ncbi:MAG: MFS transporter [Dehalococcoidia bacterium]
MERRIIISASVAHAMTHSLELTFAALLLRIGAEFGVALATLGVIANAGTFTFGATALPAGYLTDRFGPRTVVAGCMALAAACSVLVALSPTVIFLAVALAVLGAAIGFYHPAGTAMVATVSNRRGLAFAAHGVAGNIGVAMVPALAVGVAILVDWRAAYLLLAVAAAVVALLVYRLAPSRDEWARSSAAAARAPLSRGDRKLPRTSPPEQRGWFSPPLLLIYVCSIGLGFIYRGALTFLPVHMEEHLGISIFGWGPAAIAGAFTSLVLMAAIGGQVLGGVLSDRMPVERAAVPIVLISFPMLAAVSAAGGVGLLVATAAFVVANFAQQPIFNGLIADYAPPHAAGKAFGISFFLTFGVGSFAASIAGLIADRSGTSGSFAMLSMVGAALAAVTLMVALGAERRRGGMDTSALREGVPGS